ncbi:MAG: site-2 protease family protein [Anaerolineales bacterium]
MALTFLVVLVGWLFSLCLHEFSHALVAYYGGDTTVKDKGYLTFNLLKYTHPVYSILLPLAMLALGGIGLPGGAVYIEKWRLRSAKWETAVSLAGPAANVIVALTLTIILQFAPSTYTLTDLPYASIWPGLAYLAYLQVMAVLFNLLPFPPFDGYGALRPHLDPYVREKIEFLGSYSILVIFIIFWYVQPVSDAFWRITSQVASFIYIPLDWAALGFRLFQFWKL